MKVERVVKHDMRPLKKLLLIAIFFMAMGTGLELYLLDHYEDTFQMIPIICLLLSLSVFVFIQFKPIRSAYQVFKISLLLSALSGLYGTFLHLKANYEFEAEIKPSADPWSLFLESLSGAFPALAPGSMILFALIGYSYLILINQTNENLN